MIVTVRRDLTKVAAPLLLFFCFSTTTILLISKSLPKTARSSGETQSPMTPHAITAGLGFRTINNLLPAELLSEAFNFAMLPYLSNAPLLVENTRTVKVGIFELGLGRFGG